LEIFEGKGVTMSTVSLRLPNFIHKEVREIAKKEGISINQFITTALAEKMSALRTLEYLEKRALRGDRRKFEKAISKIADVPPDTQDVIAE